MGAAASSCGLRGRKAEAAKPVETVQIDAEDDAPGNNNGGRRLRVTREDVVEDGGDSPPRRKKQGVPSIPCVGADLKLYEAALDETPKANSTASRNFKYFCPICMQYFQKMFEAECCGHYVCYSCTRLHVDRHERRRDEAELASISAGDGPLKAFEAIRCPGCNQTELHLSTVSEHAPVRSYNDDDGAIVHATTKEGPVFFHDATDRASPVRVGDDYVTLRRKLMAYEETGDSTANVRKLFDEDEQDGAPAPAPARSRPPSATARVCEAPASTCPAVQRRALAETTNGDRRPPATTNTTKKKTPRGLDDDDDEDDAGGTSPLHYDDTATRAEPPTISPTAVASNASTPRSVTVFTDARNHHKARADDFARDFVSNVMLTVV